MTCLTDQIFPSRMRVTSCLAIPIFNDHTIFTLSMTV